MKFSTNYHVAAIIIVSCGFINACGDNRDTSSNETSAELSPPPQTDTNNSSAVETSTNNSSNNTQTISNSNESEENNSSSGSIDDGRNWQKASNWSNFQVGNHIRGIVTISFDIRATSNNINGVVAITAGMANAYDDLALIFRMNTDGYMDARDGDSYQSEMELEYEADQIYRVVMDADFNSRLYDVFVTYPSGQRFPVRLSASFRSTQQIESANQLVLYEAVNDELEISNFTVDDDQIYLSINSEEPEQTQQINDNDTQGNNTASTENTPSQLDLDDHYTNLPRIEVRTRDELLAALDNSQNGGKIYIHPGNYRCLNLLNRNHSANAPLLLEGLGANRTDVIFEGTQDQCGYTVRVENSSYIRLKHIATIGGTVDGISVENSNHIIIDDVDVSLSGQAGIQIRRNSSYVDVLNSVSHHNGQRNSQWGECIYAGTGGFYDFPDATSNIWIENNEFHHCGYGEGINIKHEVFNTTIRGNHVHSIRPGNPNNSQYNHAGISIETGRSSDPGSNYRPDAPREIWVENNLVEDITFGRWAHGIYAGGTGVYIINNTVRRFQENGIWINNYGNLGSPAYVYGNTIDTPTGGTPYRLDNGVNIIRTPPPTNPNQRQNWLNE